MYQGRDSCTARREGVYVRRVSRPGVDTLAEAAALAYMVLRDYRRGWTYRQGDCRRIRMTWRLAERRLLFIARLARMHGAPPRVRRLVEKLVEYAVRHRRLPRRLAGYDVHRLARRMIARVGVARR